MDCSLDPLLGGMNFLTLIPCDHNFSDHSPIALSVITLHDYTFMI